MEKLQPVIKHVFWILFGLALILPTAGWWMGTGALATQIADQENKINGYFDIPKDGANESWTTALKTINQEEEKRYQEAAMMLRKTQQQLRTWNPLIAQYLEGKPYWGLIVENVPRELFRAQVYSDEVRSLEKIIEKYDPVTDKGKVILAPGALPIADTKRWDFVLPSSDEIWEEYEDLWLLRGLLRSLARLNEGAPSLVDAPLKQITQITLHGGDRTKIDQFAKGAPPAGGGGGGGEGQPPAFASGPFTGQGAQKGGVDFRTEEIFGPQSTTGPAQTDTTQSTPTAPPGQARPKLDRYVDEDPALPFKTRGFYLKVVIDHRKVPDLLVELTNCEWPGQVLRVHQVSYNRDGAPPRPGGGSIARGRMGMPFGRGFGDPMEETTPSYSEDPTTAPADSGFDTTFDNIGPTRPTAIPGGGMTAGKGAAAVAVAMSDPYLAEVVVGGLLTIYLPPTPEELTAARQVLEPVVPEAPPEQPALPAEPEVTPPADSVPPQNPIPQGEPSAPAAAPSAAPGANANSTPAADPSSAEQGGPPGPAE